ncbi:hypothetical protein GWI33_014617 [Rhynchophorus ferrugineus]|uniref:Uncharacterized protein n=1 Tax=Rhynchophorus ferrugineus TaxID=354439 RepID=A0A834I700_RHYFE|nr:hypothetical protein GWI33_014617 [Rhynchophorus ferrugineus]
MLVTPSATTPRGKKSADYRQHPRNSSLDIQLQCLSPLARCSRVSRGYKSDINDATGDKTSRKIVLMKRNEPPSRNNRRGYICSWLRVGYLGRVRIKKVAR